MPRKRKPGKMRPHYSGALSVEFWRRVNRLDSPDRHILYALGCVLQNVEGDVLRWLSNAEADAVKGPLA